ncbi:histidine phosphatase family protein [Arsenicicoccus piscis]|uniref:Phosphoglycerate mutase n=1 Tax=Arsenicicoccus piscis TaxID=673954 RepID=A0ABQ6HL27_9MICO|nr:histidine phosphatase family protein [Arsenicicoccus piscis]MCH8627210.1 histidine phosphatase family protein [Arsenicicoccus piscis]GMA18815.1 phosphoglycerate mutase [Arsenicicoccus piscis]
MRGRKLVVVRHGQTGHNAAGLWQGQLDVELSALGVEQAAAAAPYLAALQPARIVSSDLARAARTADAIAEVAGVPATRDPRFREIHVGEWQGKSGDDVRAEYPAEAEKMLTGEDFRRGISGESVADVAARALAGAEALLDTLSDGEVAIIVSHGVAARALAAALCDLGQHQAWQVLGGLGNCHWAILGETARGGWRIEGWNLRAPDAR